MFTRRTCAGFVAATLVAVHLCAPGQAGAGEVRVVKLVVMRALVVVKAGPGAFFATKYTVKRGRPLAVLNVKAGWLMIWTSSGVGWVHHQSLGVKPNTWRAMAVRYKGPSAPSDILKTCGFKAGHANIQPKSFR